MPSTSELFPNYPDQSNWHNLGGGPKFGNADLDILLKDAVGGEYRWDDTQKLIDAHEKIRQFLNSPHGKTVTADTNQPGASGGLYERFISGEISTWWGDHSGDLGEQRKTSFGGADLRVALASGKTKEQITNHLRTHMGWLKDSNKPIGGTDGGGAENGIWTWLVGVEASTNHGQTAPVDVQPGAGGPKFGNVEYHNELKRLWDQTGDAAILRNHRLDVLEFLATAPDDKVHPNNRPPKEDGTGGLNTGMWQQITDHMRTEPRDFGRNWESSDVKITPWFGAADPEGVDPASLDSERIQFTEADWLAAKAGGHDDYDIYRHLRANRDQYKGEASGQTYDFIRQGLINRAPIYVFSDGGGNWRAELENPLWQEVGDYLAANVREHKHRTWVDEDDHTAIEYYLAQHFDGEIQDFRTDADLATIIGHAGTGAGSAGWQPGEYWSQWGIEGPPDLPGDGDDDRDLTTIQKMVAQAGLASEDPSQAKERLEYLENRFLNELYEGTDDDPAKYKTTPDEWGLDIMRLDDEGDPLDFNRAGWDDDDEDNLSGDRGDEWYETLTRGDIDWAYYQDNKLYQQAKEELGLEGTYTAGSLGVAGIRQANVWVHGQLSISTETEGPDWDPYVAKPLPAPYTPKALTITGYTPEKPKGKAPVPEDPTAPTINIPDVEIKAPDNLKPKIGKIVGE